MHTCAHVHGVAKYLLGKGLNHQIGRVGLEGGKELGKKITVHNPTITTVARISTFFLKIVKFSAAQKSHEKNVNTVVLGQMTNISVNNVIILQN